MNCFAVSLPFSPYSLTEGRKVVWNNVPWGKRRTRIRGLRNQVLEGEQGGRDGGRGKVTQDQSHSLPAHSVVQQAGCVTDVSREFTG